jgi:hypothetical protein
MEEKMTMRGMIDRLNLNEIARFDRTKFRPTTIRTTCSHIKADTFKNYKVSLREKETLVDRIK